MTDLTATDVEEGIAQSPVFSKALAYAQGIARRRSEVEITPMLMLGGLHLALSEVADTETLAPVQEYGDRLVEAHSRLKLGAGDEILPLEDGGVPLGNSVRDVLSMQGDSLGNLVVGLLTASVGIDPQEAELLAHIVQRASAHGRAKGLPQVGASLFAVAAYRLFLEGKLVGMPGLSAHMALNRAAFRFLEDEVGPLQALPEGAPQQPLPLSGKLAAAIDKSISPQARILAALNVGLRYAVAQRVRRETAYHEAGHAIACFVLQPEVPIVQVSVLSDSGESGVMRYDNTAPAFELDSSREWYLGYLAILLAGRAAECIALGPGRISAGAASDLERATNVAWHFIGHNGLDHDFGPISIAVLSTKHDLKAGWLFDKAQQRLSQVLTDAHDCATKALRDNWRFVERIVNALMKREVIDMNDVMSLLIDTGLEDVPGAVRVRSRVQERHVTFATEAGICATREGPVRYGAGDVIVKGSEGETWPIVRSAFEAAYEPVGAHPMGQDGVYRKRPVERWAFKLSDARHLVLSGGRGVLSAAAGDWILDHGGGDLAVVAGGLFDQYYERLAGA